MVRRVVALALALALAAPAACEGDWDPLSIGADLACTGCELFIETYLSKCSHYVYGAGKREIEGGRSILSVYQDRIFGVYEEFEPTMARGRKRKKVDKIINREIKKGLFPARRIHEIYAKLCEKYKVEPEEVYEGLTPTGTPEERKLRLTQAALNATVHHVTDKGQQWAIAGAEPNRKFVDFNKAMSQGTSESISSGGDCGEKLEKTFNFHAATYNETLTTSVANASRVYDSKLDKMFCEKVAKVCVKEEVPPPEVEKEPEEEVEEVEHDEL